NFKEFCKLLAKSNEEFGKKFNLKTNYSSYIIQDELINIYADVVKEIIVKDIEDIEVFGIMCDDASSKPQIVAQSYDGANVMSGKFNELQNKIKNQYPYAIYTHCMAHKMNLIVIDMCKYVKETRHVFNTLESLYVHFSNPSKNQKLTEIQTKLGIKHTTIIRLSDTRWNCRYRNIESVKNSYKSIIQALEEEIENEDDRGANEAIGVMMTFKNSRTTEYFSKLWCKIEIFAKDNGISIQTSSIGCKRKRQEPHNLKHFDTTVTISAEQNINDTIETIEDYLKKKMLSFLYLMLS
ncbi:hypothetical protein AGLY_017035, partial [Aphis glycines]